MWDSTRGWELGRETRHRHVGPQVPLWRLPLQVRQKGFSRSQLWLVCILSMYTVKKSRFQGPLSRYSMAVTQKKTYGVRRLGHGSRGGKNYLILTPTPEHLAVGHGGWTEMRTRREHKRTAVYWDGEGGEDNWGQNIHSVWMHKVEDIYLDPNKSKPWASSGKRYWLDTYITGSTQDRGN